MQAIVNDFGKILRWDGRNEILYPERLVRRPEGDRYRGGSFVCVPIFGRPPKTAAWDLPQHGPLRQLSTAADLRYVVGRSQKDKPAGRWSFRFRFPAERRYPWTYEVELQILLSRELEQLHQMVTLTRSQSCENEAGQPVSLAFHPYFATHGEPFTIKHGSALIATEKDDLRQSLQLQRSGTELVLNTERSEITLQASGYLDGYNLWTDNGSKYVCLEPMGGKLTPIFLKPGDQVVGACVITHQKK